MDNRIDWHSNVYHKGEERNEFVDLAWQKLCDYVFKRDRWTCQRCDRKIKAKKFLTAHHIIPRDEGGESNVENLITLCGTCHDIVEIAGYRNRTEIIGSDDKTTVPQKPEIAEDDNPDPYGRPEWHKWVYGGCRNPLLD